MRKHSITFSISRFDFILVALIVGLNLIGLQAVGAAAPSLQTRQFQGMILGLILMVAVSILDYTRVLRLYWGFYGLNLVLLLMVILFGESGGGAQRWISIAGLRFQPSEAAKILLILFYAKLIMKYKHRMKSFAFILVCLLLAVPALLLIIMQPDLSTTIMIFLIISVMLFVGGMSFRLVGGVLAITVPSVIIFLNVVIRQGEDQTILPHYQWLRIMSWLHPEDYEMTSAYQTMNSIMAIGSGMLTGKGSNPEGGFTSLLNSGYISQSQTDFIFTVIAEEYGFLGAVTVVLLLALIAIRLFWIAREAASLDGSIIAAGMGAWIGFQGFINIGVATGVLPNTGIPLPFVSYGLTSLLSLYIGIGFVLNVRMQNRQKRQVGTAALLLPRGYAAQRRSLGR